MVSPILTWEGTGDVPNFCPQGCGGITEDPYGGPCQACWDAVGKDDDEDQDEDDDDDGYVAVTPGEFEAFTARHNVRWEEL